MKCLANLSYLRLLITAFLLVMFFPGFVNAEPNLYKETTTYYNRIWKDEGSKAPIDFAIYRPISDFEGFFPLGDVTATSPWVGQRYGDPTYETILLKSGDLELKPPIDYRLIWTDKGSGAIEDVSIWRAIPQPGYKCLGDVANNSRQRPPMDIIKCVPKQCLERINLGNLIWNDKGTGANKDFSAWHVANRGNTFISNGSWKRPGNRIAYRLKEDCF